MTRVAFDRAFHVASIGAVLLVAVPGEADESARFAGTWINTARDRGRSAIERGIEAAIDDMFALAKPRARRRLTASNPPVRRVVLAIAGSDVRYDLGHGRRGRQPLGEWRRGQTATGDSVQVRVTQLSAEVLKLEMQAHQGGARHVFRASRDGRRLTQDVRIHSSHLPEDVRYRLVYRRAR